MSNGTKISFLFLTTVFLWNTVVVADAKPHIGTAKILPVEENNSSTHPVGSSNPFAIHHQPESGLNLIDRPPISHSMSNNDSKNDAFESLLIESTLNKNASIYLRISKLIDRGLTIKKLIFPFHSFL